MLKAGIHPPSKFKIYNMTIPLLLNKLKKKVRRQTLIDTTVSVDNFVCTYLYVCIYFNNDKKHIDASVKERPQTLTVLSEEICKRVLFNKHI